MNKFLSLVLFLFPFVAQSQIGINGVPNQTITGLPSGGSSVSASALSGCGVEYVSGLTYTVGGCRYVINNIVYNSPLTNVSLATADPSNPRIDVIYVDSTQSPSIITGTPGVTPQQPTVNPSTQLALTFVLVPAGSTTPANTTSTVIYKEGVEWVTNPANNVIANSTGNPYSGTFSVEFGSGGPAVGGTNTSTSSHITFTVPSSGTVNLSNYNYLIFYIRNKVVWPSNCSMLVTVPNPSTATFINIPIANGTFGFTISNVSTYQQISIPVSSSIGSFVASQILFQMAPNTGCSFSGFYLDEITLQAGVPPVIPPTTLMNYKGVWNSAASYNPNDTVTSSGIGYVALVPNTNVALSTVGTWAILGQNFITSLTTTGTSGLAGVTSGVLNIPHYAGSVANSDITSLTGLTTPLSVAQGGTGTTTPVLTAGTGCSGFTGTWPNITINCAGTGGSGTVNSGTANQLAYYAGTGTTVSGTNAIPNGTTATTQSPGDNTTKVATDAFVLANTSGASPFDPITTHMVMGGSLSVVATVNTTTATAASCNGTTCTITDTNTYSANQWVNLVGNVGGDPVWSPSCLNFATVQVATATGSQFTFPEASSIVPGRTGCTGSQTGTGGLVQDATNFYPMQMMKLPYFTHNGTLIPTLYPWGWPGATAADMNTNYSTYFGPTIAANTGNIWVWEDSGYNDVASTCVSAATVEGSLQALWAKIHTSGGKIIKLTLTGNTGFSSVLCPGGNAVAAAVNAWIRGQQCTNTLTSQCADVIADVAQQVNDASNALAWQQSGGFTGHYTNQGNAQVAAFNNIVFATRGSYNGNGIPGLGANTFSGQQTADGFTVDTWGVVDGGAGFAYIPHLLSYYHLGLGGNEYDMYRANALNCYSNSGGAGLTPYVANPSVCLAADFFNNNFLQVTSGASGNPVWGIDFSGGIHLQDLLMGATQPTIGASCSGTPTGDFRFTNDGKVAYCNSVWTAPIWSGISIPTGTATFTPGTNITSVACASGYSCNNTRGTVTVVAAVGASTGTIATVNFSGTLGAAPACFVSQNGGAVAFDLGNSAPTTSSFTITAGISVSLATFNVNYQCQP